MSGLTPGGFCRRAPEPVSMPVPEEPPVGTWMMDRFGGVTQRQKSGWGEPGIMPYGVWSMMWKARGPYVECSPWGAVERQARAMEEERVRVQMDLDAAMTAVEAANRRLVVATAQYSAWAAKYIKEN